VKYLLVVFLMGIFHNAGAQSAFSIVYRRVQLLDTLKENHTGIGQVLFGRLVFNDTASFFYNYDYGSEKDQWANKRSFGNKLKQHSWYYNRVNDLLAEVNIYNRVNKKFLISDTSRAFNWKLIGGEKIIAGYHCKAALAVNSKNDSTLAFYSTTIPMSYGPWWFTGLPGPILEIFDQGWNSHIKAFMINTGDYTISLHKKLIVISRDAFLNLGMRNQ